MTPRADIMVRILASQPIPLDPQCTLCERHRGYNEHLGAEKHWKALYPTYTGDGVVISQVRDRVWNKVRIAGGWVRINELDGAIEMAKGTAEPQAMPAAQQQAPPAFAGAPQMPQMTPPMQATPMQPPSAAPPPNNGCVADSNHRTSFLWATNTPSEPASRLCVHGELSGEEIGV
eukprot:g15485.t1